MALSRPYSSYEDIKAPEYRIIDDVVKKIVSIEVLEYAKDPYGDILNNSEDNGLERWLNTEEARWLSTRWLATPQLIQLHNPRSYELMIRVIVRLYEEDAVFYTLKWK